MVKKGLLNSVNSSETKHLLDDSANNQWIFVDNTDNSIPKAVLPPIPKGSVEDVSVIEPTSEVRRLWTIGASNDETIEASRPYKIVIDHLYDTYESDSRASEKKYVKTADPVLSGAAATDRQNIFTVLKNKINRDSKNYVEAFLINKLTVEGVAAITSGISVGDTLFQGANLAGATWTGKVAAVDSSWEASAGQVISVYDETGTLALDTDIKRKDGTVITNASGTNHVKTTGQGLALLDDAGYYITPDPRTRNGMSIVWAPYYNDDEDGYGFKTAELVKAIDGTYAKGIGSYLTAMLPVFNNVKNNVISGDGELVFYGGGQPESSKEYQQIMIRFKADVEPENLSQMSKNKENLFILYAEKDTGKNLYDFLVNSSSFA